MSQNEEIKNMSELKPRITENGIDYILVGDYYIPDLKLPEEQYEKLSEQVEAALQKKLLSLIRQGKDVVIDFSFWNKENRNVYKELIQKAGAETELVYMKASKELLQKRLYKRNQVLNANSPFVITDELLEHHYHAFQEPCGEGEKVILQKEDIRYE